MCPNDDVPPSFESRLVKLEQDFKKSNGAQLDALKEIIEALEELRTRLCELPPGCIPDAG